MYITVNSWGGSDRSLQGFKKPIKEILSGGNVGHVSIQMVFEVSEYSTEIIKKLKNENSRMPITTRMETTVENEKVVQKPVYEVYFSFWPDRQENRKNYLKKSLDDNNAEREKLKIPLSKFGKKLLEGNSKEISHDLKNSKVSKEDMDSTTELLKAFMTQRTNILNKTENVYSGPSVVYQYLVNTNAKETVELTDHSIEFEMFKLEVLKFAKKMFDEGKEKLNSRIDNPEDTELKNNYAKKSNDINTKIVALNLIIDKLSANKINAVNDETFKDFDTVSNSSKVEQPHDGYRENSSKVEQPQDLYLKEWGSDLMNMVITYLDDYMDGLRANLIQCERDLEASEELLINAVNDRNEYILDFTGQSQLDSMEMIDLIRAFREGDSSILTSYALQQDMSKLMIEHHQKKILNANQHIKQCKSMIEKHQVQRQKYKKDMDSALDHIKLLLDRATLGKAPDDSVRLPARIDGSYGCNIEKMLETAREIANHDKYSMKANKNCASQALRVLLAGLEPIRSALIESGANKNLFKNPTLITTPYETTERAYQLQSYVVNHQAKQLDNAEIKLNRIFQVLPQLNHESFENIQDEIQKQLQHHQPNNLNKVLEDNKINVDLKSVTFTPKQILRFNSEVENLKNKESRREHSNDDIFQEDRLRSGPKI